MNDESASGLREMKAAARSARRDALRAFASPLRFTWPYLTVPALAVFEHPPEALASALFLLFGLALLVTPPVAAVRDGRWRMVPYLMVVFAAAVALNLVLISRHPSWRADDGLGTGFYLLFAQFISLGYLVAIPALYGLTKVVAKVMRRRGDEAADG